MDIKSLLGTLTNDDSVSGLSQAAGISADSTKSILGAALPSLLSGAFSQSQNSETAEGFANALTQHAASDTSSISSFLGGVDLVDGGKIISHLLGSNASGTLSQVAAQSGATEAQTSSVLSAVAPLLMSLLGQQTSSAQSAGTGIGDIMGSLMGGSDIAGLLGGILGGGASAGASAAADTLHEVTDTAQAAAGSASSSGGLLGILGKLFGRK